MVVAQERAQPGGPRGLWDLQPHRRAGDTPKLPTGAGPAMPGEKQTQNGSSKNSNFVASSHKMWNRVFNYQRDEFLEEPSQQAEAAKTPSKLPGAGDRDIQRHQLQWVETGSIFQSKGPRRCNFNL